MFEVGWTEMLVIAIVLIVVVGPKDLPRMLRTFGKTTAKLRAMAGDFRKQFDEAGGTAASFRDKMLDTFAGQKQLMVGSLETLAIVLGVMLASRRRGGAPGS